MELSEMQLFKQLEGENRRLKNEVPRRQSRSRLELRNIFDVRACHDLDLECLNKSERCSERPSGIILSETGDVTFVDLADGCQPQAGHKI